MPTYEYKREDGSTFEIIQKMSENPLTECPTTGQKVRRVVSGGGGVVYKGEGWYVTDYKNGGKNSEKTKAKENSGDSSSKDSAPKAEQKSAKETPVSTD
ncbi:MAG: zinc ribbon domain-containing protein [Balneolaceae bacterium]|nr:zinc ribbon domain-containing protein [Balneolaceae bacterium]